MLAAEAPAYEQSIPRARRHRGSDLSCGCRRDAPSPRKRAAVAVYAARRPL